jgi:hypothetical protein
VSDPVLAIIQKADLGYLLDEMVHEEKSAEATGINNAGPEAQLTYLRSSGWGDQWILERLGVLDHSADLSP